MLIACVFLYAGVFKMLRPAAAVLALRALDLPLSSAEALTFVVTVIELQIGTLLLLGIQPYYATRAAIICLFVFLFFLLYLLTLASPPSCGCPDLVGLFSSNRKAALFGVFRNIVLIALLGYCVAAQPKCSPIENRKQLL